MKTRTPMVVAAIASVVSLGAVLPAQADTVDAYCDYYPAEVDYAEVSMPCVFSQEQGYVAIEWEDGALNEFEPTGEEPGVYVDERGGMVYEQEGGLGDEGLVFELEDGSIYVYWN